MVLPEEKRNLSFSSGNNVIIKQARHKIIVGLFLTLTCADHVLFYSLMLILCVVFNFLVLYYRLLGLTWEWSVCVDLSFQDAVLQQGTLIIIILPKD
jgi:hypothetical protein